MVKAIQSMVDNLPSFFENENIKFVIINYFFLRGFRYILETSTRL